MKYLIATILLLVNPVNELNKIAKVNEHKEAAKQAYLEEDFEKASYHYSYLVDSLGVVEDEVLLNLANSLYKLQDTASAKNFYNQVIDGGSGELKSNAHQQLGQLDFQSKDYKSALDHYKNALRANPENEDARYNYELLKKIIEEQEQQQENQDQQNQENQDQQNQDQENQDNQEQQQDQQNQEQEDQESQEQQENQEQQQQDQEGEEQDQEQSDQDSEEQQEQEQPEEGEQTEEEQQQEPSLSDKLEEMNISEEKAKMILEAMKNNEIQYLQQNKRKAKKKKDSKKPDW